MGFLCSTLELNLYILQGQVAPHCPQSVSGPCTYLSGALYCLGCVPHKDVTVSSLFGRWPQETPVGVESGEGRQRRKEDNKGKLCRGVVLSEPGPSLLGTLWGRVSLPSWGHGSQAFIHWLLRGDAAVLGVGWGGMNPLAAACQASEWALARESLSKGGWCWEPESAWFADSLERVRAEGLCVWHPLCVLLL